MIADSVKFRGHRCFKKDWSGFEKVKPINVIIGRNNSGKSHLLDLAEQLCHTNPFSNGWDFLCSGTLDEKSLKNTFNPTTSEGYLKGRHWNDHGKILKGIRVEWEHGEGGVIGDLVFPDPDFQIDSKFGTRSTEERIVRLKSVLKNAVHPFTKKRLRRLYADRDIRPEVARNDLTLRRDGQGATNIIRRYLVSSSESLPRELIQIDLLDALNSIFGTDARFTEIEVQHHDETDTGSPEDVWEVFLAEEKKGLIPLSRSGSGLRTVFLVLLNLLVVPEIDKLSKRDYVFGFEELENNLHPSLLRRLFQFLEEYALEEQSTIFLSTHSSVALDLFGVSENAQIIHVSHDGESAKATTVSAHFDHLGVISELGAKPSDLLQANGIIWVEGPSDCIYLNRWIDILSAGDLQEGRDYQCAFYGGSLLARTQFTSPEEAEKEIVNLFRINPNIVVVCDGDRAKEKARVKDRVRRISAEVKRIPGSHIWVTGAREIENYNPGSVLETCLERASVSDPTRYEHFYPRKSEKTKSFLEKRLQRKTLDKMDLAVMCVPHMTLGVMSGRFDWLKEMTSIVERIREWNY